MYKAFLSVMVYGFLLVACVAPAISTPTVTAIPASTAVIPSPTLAPVTLLAEKDLETQTGTAYSLDWSPDGETLAVASGVEITLLSNDLKQRIAVFKPSSGALTATWSPDQSKFATVVGFRNATITLWDIANSQLTLAQEISAGADQYGSSWSPDGKLLATLANDRKSIIQIWNADTWQELHKFDLPYANPRRALDWDTDSKTLYDAGELDGQVVYFALDVNTGTVQELGKLPVDQVDAFAISPDLKRIAAADASGKVQIIDAMSGESLMEFQAVAQPVDLAWNPQNTTLAILGYETALQLWEITP